MQILFIQQTYWKLMVKKLFDPLFGCIMIMIEEQKHYEGIKCSLGIHFFISIFPPKMGRQ